MSDDTHPETPRHFAVTMAKFNPDKIRGIIAQAPIPREFYEPIGQIAASWSFFEQDFDLYITGMLKSQNRSQPNWERQSFKKRKELFRDLFPKVFAANAEILRLLDETARTAVDLQWKRNTLLHGSIRTKIEWGGVFLEASSFHNKNPVTLRYNLDQIIDFYYDIAHLCGGMRSIIAPTDAYPKISSAGKSALQVFARNNLPHRASNPTP